MAQTCRNELKISLDKKAHFFTPDFIFTQKIQKMNSRRESEISNRTYFYNYGTRTKNNETYRQERMTDKRADIADISKTLGNIIESSKPDFTAIMLDIKNDNSKALYEHLSTGLDVNTLLPPGHTVFDQLSSSCSSVLTLALATLQNGLGNGRELFVRHDWFCKSNSISVKHLS